METQVKMPVDWQRYGKKPHLDIVSEEEIRPLNEVTPSEDSFRVLEPVSHVRVHQSMERDRVPNGRYRNNRGMYMSLEIDHQRPFWQH